MKKEGGLELNFFSEDALSKLFLVEVSEPKDMSEEARDAKSALMSALETNQPVPDASKVFLSVARGEKSGELVGFVAGYVFKNHPERAEIVTYFTRERLRLLGIAKMMHRFTIEKLKSIGITEVVGIVNEEEKLFAEALGYRNDLPQEAKSGTELDPSDYLLKIS